MNFDPIDKWKEVHETSVPILLGHAESYNIACRLLDDLNLVEDWGCGTTYAKQFFKYAQYVGVDGSDTAWTDEVDNLATRSSNPDGILIRHVLEHNDNWRDILKNAVKCFKTRLVLVVFTRLKKRTDQVPLYIEGIPYYSFSAKDIEAEFNGLQYIRMTVNSDTLWVVDKS